MSEFEHRNDLSCSEMDDEVDDWITTARNYRKRAEQAEAERDVARRDAQHLREALEAIDRQLTTVGGDNVPRGESCKNAARIIARATLASSAGGTNTETPA